MRKPLVDLNALSEPIWYCLETFGIGDDDDNEIIFKESVEDMRVEDIHKP